MTWGLKTAGASEPLQLRRVSSWQPQRWRLLFALALLAALVVSRVPLAPRHLITFDEINFALSIDNFNPRAHQPQPPGYPLFVGLLKLLSLAIPKVETVFLIAALLLSAASLALLWMLGEQMFGRTGGLIAAVLLLANPPFWYSALTNPVRLGLSTGAAATALCLWLAWRRGSSRWFVAAAGVLGLAAGMRPTLMVEMAPVMLWVAIALRLNWKTALAAIAAFGAAVLLWLPPLIAATGGLASSLHVLRGYTGDTTRGTSLLGGATWGAALHMANEAITWSSMGVLTWIWAVPWARRRSPNLVRDTLGSPFLMLWFLPSLAMSAIFHVGDPDQTLTIIPVTCLIGARVLMSFEMRSSRRAYATLIGVALLLNVFLFFKPISKIEKFSTYTNVAMQGRYMGGLAEGVGAIQDPGGVTVIFPPTIPGWRQLLYYTPAARIVAVGPDVQGSRSLIRVYRRRGQTSFSTTDVFRVPACGVIAFVDPVARPADAFGRPVQTTRSDGVWYFRAAPGISLRTRGIRFMTEDQPCPGDAATAANFLGTGIVGLAAPPAPRPPAVVSMVPHFAAGNTYVTGFYVLNSSDQAAHFSIAFHDDQGKPVSVPVGNLGALTVVSDLVPANGFRYFEAGDPASKTMLAGSALVRADASITVQALFRHRAARNVFYEAAIPASTGAVAAEVPFDEGGVTTAVAIANLDPAQAATVVCTARNGAGVVIPNAVPVPVLQPMGHWSGFKFAPLAGQRGTLLCTANTKIAMIGLRSMTNGAISSLPVVTK